MAAHGLLSNPYLAGSIGLLAAGGPNPYPVSLGQGLLSGLGAAQQSIGQNLERQRMEQQMRAEQERVRIAQLQLQAQQAAAQRQEQFRQAQKGLLAGTQYAPLAGYFDDPAQVAGLLTPKTGPLAQKISDFTAAAGRPPTQAEIQRMSDAAPPSPLVQINQGDKLVGAAAEKLVGPRGETPPPNITWDQAAMGGFTFRTTPTEGEAKAQASAETALADLDRLATAFNAGQFETGPIQTLLDDARLWSGLGSEDFLKNRANAVSLVEGLSNTLLAAVRGAQVGPLEQKRFDKQLPRLSQPPELFRANLERTRRNLIDLYQRAAEIRRTGAAMPTPEAPSTAAPSAALEGERIIGNRRFIKRDGQWYEVD